MVRQCINTARQNLVLGRWVRGLSPRQRLLHQEAHSIFNAAVIVLLHQLAFANAEVSRDANDIYFAIDVFEQEASLGNNFGIDCSRVLQDLQSLVYGLREHQNYPPVRQSLPPGDQQLNLNHINMPQNSVSAAFADIQQAMGDNIGLQRELQTWLDNDYFQLYNDYML